MVRINRLTNHVSIVFYAIMLLGTSAVLNFYSVLVGCVDGRFQGRAPVQFFIQKKSRDLGSNLDRQCDNHPL